MMKIMRYARLLPVLLAAATLLLGVKVHNVARALVGSDLTSSPIAEAHAEASPRPAAAVARNEPHAAPSHKGTEPAAAPAASAGDAGSTTAAAPAAAPETPAPSAHEVQVLQQLAARRQALDARTEDIDRRADLLRAGEARLDQKLKELRDLETLLQGLLKSHDAQQEEQIRSLVKIYENMKPKDAARILEQLEMATLLQVAERMAERKLAPVMANMNPAKAKAITEELAKLRQLVAGARAAGG
jgi:flagellar motility protein MotE (MotC chaperone)